MGVRSCAVVGVAAMLPPVNPRRAHLVMVWLLCWAQLATMLAGSVGVVVCREANGDSHVEWASLGCCVDDHAADRAEHNAATIARDADSCSVEPCVDELLALEPATVNARGRRTSIDTQPATPADPAPGRASITPRMAAAPATLQEPDAGPPRQVACALRTTVLIL